MTLTLFRMYEISCFSEDSFLHSPLFSSTLVTHIALTNFFLRYQQQHGVHTYKTECTRQSEKVQTSQGASGKE